MFPPFHSQRGAGLSVRSFPNLLLFSVTPLPLVKKGAICLI